MNIYIYIYIYIHIHQEREMGKKLGIFFWGHFCVASWTFVIINLSMMLKKLGENINLNLHKYIRI
jgi:hypothetical protein